MSEVIQVSQSIQCEEHAITTRICVKLSKDDNEKFFTAFETTT